MSWFQGKAAVVTGGGRGIGRATALHLADLGCQVTLLSRTLTESMETARLVAGRGGQAIAVRCDVASESEVEAAFAQHQARWGRLDVLVNNAGVIVNAKIEDMKLLDFESVMAVNVRGVFLCSRAAFKAMAGKGGSIVNISSLAGVRGTDKFPGFSAYTASKFAVIGLTEAHAAEGKERGIRVNAIAPGAIDTAMLRQAAPHLRSQTKPEDVAEIVAYLANGDAARALSGAVIEVFSNA